MCTVEQFRCTSENTHQVTKRGEGHYFQPKIQVMGGERHHYFLPTTLPQILSINDWNREKEKCIPLRFRCDGRFLFWVVQKDLESIVFYRSDRKSGNLILYSLQNLPGSIFSPLSCQVLVLQHIMQMPHQVFQKLKISSIEAFIHWQHDEREPKW